MPVVRQNPDERQRPLRDYPASLRTGVICVVIIAVVGYVFAWLWHPIGEHRALLTTPGVWVMVLLMLAADLYPSVPWLRDTKGQVLIHWSASLSLALMLAYGPIALTIFPLLGLIAVIGHGGAPWRIVVNVSVTVIEGLAAAAVMRAFGDGLMDGDVPVGQTVLVGLLIACLWNVVNVVSIVSIVYLARGFPSWLGGLRSGFTSTVFWFAGLLLAPLMAMLVVVSPFLLLMLLPVMMAVHHNIAAVARANRQARTDPLTSLGNRRAAIEALETIQLTDDAEPTMVMLVDLDGFKAVNDTYGHDVGDDVLVAVSARLRETVPESILVARLGGDEFILIGGPVGDAPVLASMVRTGLRRPIEVGGVPLAIDGTFGWFGARYGDEPLDVIRRADRRLYEAKKLRVPTPSERSIPELEPVRGTVEPTT